LSIVYCKLIQAATQTYQIKHRIGEKLLSAVGTQTLHKINNGNM